MDNSFFAKRLAEERSKNNLTQKELAKRVGVSQGLISQYENGTNLPCLEIFIELTKALSCTPNNLLQDYTKVSGTIEDYFELIQIVLQMPSKDLEKVQSMLKDFI